MTNEKRIYSRNADYQKIIVLKTNRNKRYRYGEFLVEGVRNINEAIKNQWVIASFLYCGERQMSDWAKEKLRDIKTEVNFNCSAEVMDELSGKEDSSELLAIVKMRDDFFDISQLDNSHVIVLFDRPSNHGNLGTMIRTCDALGVDLLILTGHGVDLYAPEVVTAGMGSFFHTPVIRLTEQSKLTEMIGELKEKNPDFKVIGTTAHKKNSLYETGVKPPCLLMIGNETMGLNQAYTEIADLLVTIPMAVDSSASSLNVACAGAILLYEIFRQ